MLASRPNMTDGGSLLPKLPAGMVPGSPEHLEYRERRRAVRAARMEQVVPAVEVEDSEPPDARAEVEIPRVSKPRKRGASKSEVREEDVRTYLKMVTDYLASQEGRQHWRREEDELVLVTVPGTRCFNRLSKKLREQLLTISDPAALLFGVMVIFGPSLAQEVMNARMWWNSHSRRNDGGYTEARGTEYHRADASGVSGDGAGGLGPPPGLPLVGIG